jgi:hypothetical protein
MDFYIQFVVWIICGIEISWKWVVIFFVISFTLYSRVQILVIKKTMNLVFYYGLHKYVCLELMHNCEWMYICSANMLLQYVE